MQLFHLPSHFSSHRLRHTPRSWHKTDSLSASAISLVPRICCSRNLLQLTCLGARREETSKENSSQDDAQKVGIKAGTFYLMCTLLLVAFPVTLLTSGSRGCEWKEHWLSKPNSEAMCHSCHLRSHPFTKVSASLNARQLMQIPFRSFRTCLYAV